MTTIALAHGAWGAPSDWNDAVAVAGVDARVRFDLVDVSTSIESIEVNEVWMQVIDALAAALPDGPLVLGGYSLGARLMLGLAQHESVRPRLRGLFLVAGTAGLPDPSARAARIAIDDERAAFQARDPRAFLEAFWGLPLFAGLRDHPRRAAWLAERTARAQRDPERLAFLMRGLSVGRMPTYWANLQSLAVPTVVMNGAADAEYLGLGGRLVSALPQARHVIVEGAGHALLLEAPSAVGAGLAGLVEEIA